jgi:AraC family transcriptional regulator of adaptative response / DNA-3-methyladenine glycosylase II
MQLVNAPIERAGVIAARAGAIRGLARRVAEKTVSFGPLINQDEMVAALRAVPGIGEWTASYIAMRALGEPDAFPSGDLVLRRMAGVVSPGQLDLRAELWRPWRAYAVILLWQGATDRSGNSKPTHSSPAMKARVLSESIDREARRVRG